VAVSMLPRVYYPLLQNNLYEKRAASITAQLFQSKQFDIDYDQLLAKKPTKNDAVFAWHVDLAYWPDTPDTRTATFSLALDATTRANGCLRFVDGSHLEPSIRPHRPVAEDREKAHAIQCAVNERTADNPNGELVSYVEVGRGDVTVHNERVVHGSGGNYTDGWRRTYVLAFRHSETIALERKAGFTHSHNDTGCLPHVAAGRQKPNTMSGSEKHQWEARVLFDSICNFHSGVVRIQQWYRAVVYFYERTCTIFLARCTARLRCLSFTSADILLSSSFTVAVLSRWPLLSVSLCECAMQCCASANKRCLAAPCSAAM